MRSWMLVGILLSLVGEALCADILRDTTVLIRGKDDKSYCCSGGLVSKTGGEAETVYVFTAKHCAFKKDVVVAIPGIGIRTATKIYSSMAEEGIVVFAVNEAGKYPSLRCSEVKPQSGDVVRYCGYPGASSLDEYVEGSGKMTGGSTAPEYQSVSVNVVTNIAIPGMSGGPLVNSKNELVGANHGRNVINGKNVSLWLSFKELSLAREACFGEPKIRKVEGPQQAQQPRLVFFCIPNCQGCDQLKADRDGGVFGEYSKGSEFVTYDGAKWSNPELAKSFEKTTGIVLLGGQTGYPMTWIEGTKHCRVGYTATAEGRAGFLGWVQNLWQSVCEFFHRIFIGTPAPQVIISDPVVPKAPKTVDEVVLGDTAPPEPIAEPGLIAPDWSKVRCAIVAAKLDVGMAKGLGIRLAIEHGQTPIERKLNEIFQNKATVQLVTQRVHLEMFQDVCEAARIKPDPVWFVVLVDEMDLGAKGGIVEMVEEAIAKLIPDKVPITVFFNRVQGHKADFAAITAILDGAPKQFSRAVPSLPTEPEVRDDSALLNSLGSLLTDKLKERIDPIVEKLDQPIAETEPEEKSIPAKILAFCVATLTGGWTVTQLRLWVRKKARDALYDGLGSLVDRFQTEPIVTPPPTIPFPAPTV